GTVFLFQTRSRTTVCFISGCRVCRAVGAGCLQNKANLFSYLFHSQFLEGVFRYLSAACVLATDAAYSSSLAIPDVSDLVVTPGEKNMNRRAVGSSNSASSLLSNSKRSGNLYLSVNDQSPNRFPSSPSGDDLGSLEEGGRRSSEKYGNIVFRHFWTSSTRHLETWTKFLHRSHLGYRRIMDREATYSQSFGRWNIKRVREGVAGIKNLYEQDQFHTIINMDTSLVLLILLVGYISIVTGFAACYLAIGLLDGCALGITNLREAYYFSLETMTTVGYGTQDVFFGGCWSMLFVITAQACVGLLIDAALIGIIFARLSRPQTRAATVVFSKTAVIRRVRGEFYFLFQAVGDLRKHQLLDAHVRCYVIRHDRLLPAASAPPGVDPEVFLRGQESGGPRTVFFQTHNMRLQHPDDELGSAMLLVLPQASFDPLVVHRIDAWSPMMPPPRWMSAQGVVQWGLHGDADYARAPWERRAAASDAVDRDRIGAEVATTDAVAAEPVGEVTPAAAAGAGAPAAGAASEAMARAGAGSVPPKTTVTAGVGLLGARAGRLHSVGEDTDPGEAAASAVSATEAGQ
ncbi:unnamed protein product, partial [Phaeothamnion confervicola]